jgi:opacity protein-like surface antigen
MRTRYFGIATALLLLCSPVAFAERGIGWDFGADVVYQDSQDIRTDDGSSASLEDDIGLALAFGYRFSERLELTFGLDWNAADYDFSIASQSPAGGLISNITGSGEIESFTPTVGLNFNLMEGPLTPYVSGNVGWAFIDTNIPDAPPQTACWWDPWWGYYCGTFQSTRSIDELTYGLGAGVRWDLSETITLRFGYEKHWVDVSEATSTPGFDRIKLGVAARY